ncbi:GNAT family N-acetyltransferase [Fibrobacter sp.]|uniref:GNAT family N-acetyltransferase n=1 Tax=Fibrobacter sp. TaxID=35828 RepID=UPI00388F1010
MLYKIAHILRDRFGFLWNLVEWMNALVFALTHKSALKKIPAVLQECSETYTLRLAESADAPALAKFFAEQPQESFEFFKPHAFDEKSLLKIIRNKAFLTFLVLDKDAIVGYFFLRCFVNGKSFRGKIVDYRYRGKGIAKLEGEAMTRVSTTLGIRMFGTISPDNYASLASSKAVNEVVIVKTLDNGYYYIEYLPKSPN